MSVKESAVFMANEKKLTDKIETYENNINFNKNIYELTRLPSKYALQNALNGTPSVVALHQH